MYIVCAMGNDGLFRKCVFSQMGTGGVIVG